MNDDNEITLVRTSTGDLVEAGTTKMQEIENKISEIESNLTHLSNLSGDSVSELVQLAIASQNPAYYDVLSKLITATAKANQVAIMAVQSRADLYSVHKGGNSPAGIDDEAPTIVNNNLIMTTTELLDHIMNQKNAGKKTE